MEPDRNIDSVNDKSQPGNIPPVLSPPPISDAPPLLPPSVRKGPKSLAVLLSLYLGLFLAEGIASLIENSFLLFAHVEVFTILRGILFLFVLLLGIVVYGLIAFCPGIPKWVFLPLCLFSLVTGLIMIPFLIYSPSRMQEVEWAVSLLQIVLGFGLLYRLQRGFKFRWPFVTVQQLGERRFTWKYFISFLLANVFLLLPGTLIYLAVCAGLAVNHFSEGFLTLRPSGLSVQVRTYTRKDGKRVRLVPMAHVAESGFYRKVARSFPTNSLILIEGVTDNQHLLTNRISYKRMATSLGLSEQQKEFRPAPLQLVPADVDVQQFAPSTIDFLNLVMFVHAKGLNTQTLGKLLQYQPPADFEEQIWGDLLKKRNQRLLQELYARLPQTEEIIIPWGAAHMPGIAREIQKAGFSQNETQEYTVIRFGSARR